jgi:Ca2+-transporting ATPase
VRFDGRNIKETSMVEWYKKQAPAVVKELAVEPSSGLSDAEALKRLAQYGPNMLQKPKKINLFALFIGQFKDVLIIVLLISAAVSLGISFIPSQKSDASVRGEQVLSTAMGCNREVNALVGPSPSDEFCSHPAEICHSELADMYRDECRNVDSSEEEGPKEAILIFAIVITIAVIGFLNEYKAEKTVEALKKLVGQKAKVRRSGKIIEVDAETLVPGDILVLEEGQKIPADMRILVAKNLAVNESSLTGESVPVSKDVAVISAKAALGDQKNMLFAGTFTTTGTGEAIIVETGSTTELGKIAKMVTDVEDEETPMQKKLDDLGKKLGIFIMAICAVVFVIVFFFVREAADKELIQRMIFAFTAAVALAVAAIPEGLAFVVRISLALGARRMAAKNALVRKLSAVEALGSTDVICSDKTGTLTKGEMTVRELWVGGRLVKVDGRGYSPEGEMTENGRAVKPDSAILELLRVGALCNNAHLRNEGILGDPTEAAVLVSAAKAGMQYEEEAQRMERIDEIPFTSERKRMSTLHKADKGYYVAAKGATEFVLEHCTHMLNAKGKTIPLTATLKKQILDENRRMASEALRVLGFAYKPVAKKISGEKAMESNLIFAGLQGMMDPPREEVIEVIHKVQTEAGMRVIMITGDYIETAKAIATEIGLEGEALSGADIDAMSPEEFARKAEEVSVYARVNPEHKIRIVQALKHHGHQVAMTGDGVNDAPAIKAADIGIAMGITGTDAAKEAADLILLDDKFLTIINAIEEGRGIFDNVRKFVNFLISCNIAEVLVILFGIIFFNNLLLTAAQLLFINIVTDGLPAVALGSDPAQKDVLRAKPKHFQEPILTRRVWIEIFVFGTLMTIVLIAQYWFNHTHESTFAAVSAAFTSMVIFEMVRLVDIRTDYAIPWFSNPWLSVAIASSVILQIAVLYFEPLARNFSVGPLSNHDWFIMVAGSIFLFIAMKALNPIFEKFGPETVVPD